MFHKCKECSVDYMQLSVECVVSVLDEQTFDHDVMKELIYNGQYFCKLKNNMHKNACAWINVILWNHMYIWVFLTGKHEPFTNTNYIQFCISSLNKGIIDQNSICYQH